MWFVTLALAVVAVARLSVWRSRPQTRRFTLAIAALAACYLPVLPLDGTNPRPLEYVHLVLLMLAMWLLGVVYLRQLKRRSWQRAWTWYSAVTLVAVLALATAGAVDPTVGGPALDTDPVSLAFTAALYAHGVCSAALGLWAAGAALSDYGVRGRAALLALWAGLGVSVAYVLLVLALWAWSPDVLSTRHGDLFEVMLMPALLGLAVAGLAGLMLGGSERD